MVGEHGHAGNCSQSAPLVRPSDHPANVAAVTFTAFPGHESFGHSLAGTARSPGGRNDLPQHADLHRPPLGPTRGVGPFYNEVFGWEVEPRPAGVFHRIVPGQQLPGRRRAGPDRQLAHGHLQRRQRQAPPRTRRRRPPRAREGWPHRPRVDPRQRRRRVPTPSWTGPSSGARPNSGATTTGRSSTVSTTPSWTRGGTRLSCGPRAATTRSSPGGVHR